VDNLDNVSVQNVLRNLTV